MHEVSLAQALVEQAVEAAERAGSSRVVAVRVRVGRLAGVETGALRFAYDVVTKGTPLEGSRLDFVDVPVVVWCAFCLSERELPNIQRLRCPACDTPCGEIRQGRELELDALEVESREGDVAPVSA